MATQTTESAIEPKIILHISNDGGFSWGPGLEETPGKVGERLARCHWHKLGYSRDRVFRITVTAPVKWVLIGATMRVDPEVGK